MFCCHSRGTNWGKSATACAAHPGSRERGAQVSDRLIQTGAQCKLARKLLQL
jgi:hypothetical protein